MRDARFGTPLLLGRWVRETSNRNMAPSQPSPYEIASLQSTTLLSIRCPLTTALAWVAAETNMFAGRSRCK